MNQNLKGRRKFLKQITGTTMALSTAPLAVLAGDIKRRERILRYSRKFSSNDRINIAAIGLGIMGFNNLKTSLKIPGVQLIAGCDLYTGRLERMKELYDKDIFTTNDYRKILDNPSVDAVIISTSDHWHVRIASEALKRGKNVYLEKPMVHQIDEGWGLINDQKSSGKILQVGSQRVSSIVYAKAMDLLQSGEIGELNMVNAIYDRQSALGAWEYTMPDDESPGTVDWEKYVEGMGALPYDPKKFFWWRNYKEFGTGVAGDLFVHLISGVNLITHSMGPDEIFASGQLSYWKDGRNVPDIMTGVMKYNHKKEHPAFQLTLQVNFISGTGGSETIRLVGSEGTINIDNNGLTVHHSIMPEAPGIGGWDALTTYPAQMQERLLRKYNEKYSEVKRKRPEKNDIIFRAPEGYSEHLEHHLNFFDSVRNGEPVIEDVAFGLRAAAPALACNKSYFEKKIIHWDPENMKLREI